MKQAVMIIAMGTTLTVAAPVFSGPPDPVAFTHSMELGDLRQAEIWLDGGMSPDYLGSRLGSGLMIAAWEGKLELMALFAARGANINLLNAHGESALALAAWRGQLEAVQWLVANGARVNAAPRQWSALHYAVFAGHAAVVDYLLAQGADVHAQTTNGSSTLMMAVYEGHQGLARRLIELGVDRQVRNDWGDGALEWAMRQNRLEIARMVSSPDEFNVAISQPKESWGEPVRSIRSSKELEALLAAREKRVEQGLSTEAIDRKIAAERVRIVRADLDRSLPERAATLEISASRRKPGEQSANVVYDGAGKAVAFKAPPATYVGKPKMPPKAAVRNY